MLAIKNEVMEIEAGWTVQISTMPIIDGVQVVIYDNREAVLRINDANVIEFHWTPEAAAMFRNIDIVEPIELLELLARLDMERV